jgi:hypothetical protein
MPKPTLSLRLNEFTEKKLRRPFSEVGMSGLNAGDATIV